MSWLASDTGFPLRHAFWLETVLHDRARQLSYAILLMAVMSALLPWGPIRHLSRLQRFEAISGSLLALLAVNLMKSSSQTSCPWDLEAFGGVAHYVSHWQWFTADGGPGRCFPGGHASTGFAFLALAWPWLESPRAGDRRIGRCVLATFVVAGVLFGVAQTLRGAHYPSHTLWTALICWAVTWAWHRSSVFLMEKVQ
ncbi:phosphatase PAP2 family protein [Tepidicella baoligensis]|uniref:phosphatase PAP2 family protein n=1 Tax=Tepidicella baoligensis TaxID=2707016 RepID=UPI001FE83E78|nr:phosphatase PAP2 family protein [Tepidicella baoligensis]